MYKQEVSGSRTIAVLEDLSSNGTWVGGVIVGRNNRRTLENGDEIEFAGAHQYTFRYPPHMQASAFRGAYDLGRQLGSGHFATVHMAVDKKSGQEFAVKIFRKRRNEDRARTSGLQQEIAVLMSVSHSNILCLQGTYDEDDGVYLVLELAKEGELFNYIINHSKLTEVDSRKIFKQLFNGLNYLVRQTCPCVCLRSLFVNGVGYSMNVTSSTETLSQRTSSFVMLS
jgi:serine/threonine-protein kinase Chk2